MLEAGGGQSFVALCGALAGLCLAVALRELAREAPGALRWAGLALAPLARAGREGRLPTQPEHRRLALAGGVFGAVSGWTFGGVALAFGLALVAPLGTRAMLRRRRARYVKRVAEAMPEVANALADSLAAGRSLRGALIELSGLLEGEAATEFGLVARELELGSSTAGAITALRRRLDASRIDSFCAALLAGRAAGGDLAALSRRFATAAAEQDRAARDAKSATAQARFTGLLVVLMPTMAGLLAELLNPGFIASTLRSPVALALLGLALLMQLGGYLAIRRLAGGASRGQ